MANSRIRFGQTGAVSNPGTPDQVLAAKGGKLPRFADPTGGGSVTPWPLVGWVDANSTATGTPDGSIAHPFLDIQPAITAGFVVLMIAPGAYTDVTLTGGEYLFYGLAPQGGNSLKVAIDNIITTDVITLALQNVDVLGTLDDTATVGDWAFNVIDSVVFGGVLGSGHVDIISGTCLNGALNARCLFGPLLNVRSVELYNSDVNGAITSSVVSSIVLINSSWTEITDGATLPDAALITLYNSPGGTIAGNDGTVLKASADGTRPALLGTCGALGSAILRNINATSTMGLTGTLQAFNSSIDGTVDTAAADFDGCQLGAGVNTNSINAKQSNFSGPIVSGDANDLLEDCTCNDTSDFSQGVTLNTCIMSAAMHSFVNCAATDTIFRAGQVRVDGVATFANCQLLDAAATHLLIGGALTVNELRSCVFAGVLQLGDGVTSLFDSLFQKAIATTGAGTAKFYNCQADTVTVGSFSVNSAKLFLDACTEFQFQAAGVDIPVITHALDLGQLGDATPVIATVTLDCTGPTRAVCRTAAAQVLTLDETGGVAKQGFPVDTWSPNTIAVHDSAGATIATMAAQAAGKGARYFFQIDAGTGKFVASLPGFVKLAA